MSVQVYDLDVHDKLSMYFSKVGTGGSNECKGVFENVGGYDREGTTGPAGRDGHGGAQRRPGGGLGHGFERGLRDAHDLQGDAQ